jgi:hypothetical protein
MAAGIDALILLAQCMLLGWSEDYGEVPAGHSVNRDERRHLSYRGAY